MAQRDDFLTSFIGNRDRARMLRVFLFNPNEVFTAALMAKRARVSTRAVLREVKVLTRIGIVRQGKTTIQLANGSKRKVVGRQKVAAWTVNQDFKHLRALTAFAHEVSPVRYDNIVSTLKRVGRVSALILSGSFMGDASRPADLILAADTLNERKVASAIRALEPAIGREIRYAAFSTPEFRYRLTVQDRLLRDTLDFPHLVLLDRTRML